MNKRIFYPYLSWKPAVYFLASLFVIVITACGGRPSYVIDEDDLVNLMADMQLAEAYSSSGIQGMTPKERLDLGKAVLAAHGFTQEELDTTLAWYGRNVDEYTLLFEKVDQKINKKRQKIKKETGGDDVLKEEFDLWKWGHHGIVSPLGIADGWILSISEPDLEKGDRISWSLYLKDQVNLNGLLGVEYSDGSSAAVSSTYNRKNKVQIDFQTDTAKTVSRIYGSLTVKDRKDLPLYADSIKVIRQPFDSLEYRNLRGQKHYGVMVPKKIELPKDTIPADSISTDTLTLEPEKPKPEENKGLIMYKAKK